jgi:hypothetical protein
VVSGDTMRRMRAGCLALLMTASAAGGRARGATEAGEYELKAAFLYNFAKFVEWPDEAFAARSSLCVGIVGRDPFGGALDAMLRDKTIHDRPIEIARFERVPEAGRCQVLFFVAERAGDAARAGAGALTVVDDAANLTGGGIIGFAMEGKKLRFVIDADAAERAGLKLSAQLMKLAMRVQKDDGT